MIKCDKGFYREKKIKEDKELMKQSIIIISIILSVIISCIFNNLRESAIEGTASYTIFENMETLFGVIFIISFARMVLYMFSVTYKDTFMKEDE